MFTVMTEEAKSTYLGETIGARSEDFNMRVLKKLPIEGTTLPLHVRSNANATIAIGGVKVTTDSPKGDANVVIDFGSALRELVGKTTASDVTFALGWVVLPVSITTPDGGHREGTIDLEGPRALLAWLQDLTEGPILLDGETAGPSNRKTVMVATSSGTRVFGGPTTFAQIDLIALQTWQLREKECGPYVDDKGGNATTVKLSMSDVSIRMFDRRAGKQIGVKTFKASGVCPKTIFASSRGEDAFFDEEKIYAWAQTFLKN